METKKNENVDINRKTGLFFNIGLCLSLLFTLGAFSIVVKEDLIAIDLAEPNLEINQMIEEPPLTDQITPIKPVFVQPDILVVENDKKVEKITLEIPEDTTLKKDTRKYVETAKYVPPTVEKTTKEPKDDEGDGTTIFNFVEGEKAEFIGGYKAFKKFIESNYEYPRSARRISLEGTISVQFIVERDGSITEIKVLRGVSPECDAEAIRVIKKVPAWKPAKQRGRAVRNRIVLPIKLKLG